MVWRPHLSCQPSRFPHVFLTCGPFIGFLGFFGVRQGYSCVDVDRQDDYSADSPAKPCAVRLWWRFFPEFRDFALVWDHLRNFRFYSWASLLVLPFLLRLPILLSLSLKVTNLGVFAAGHLLWWSLFLRLGNFLSVEAVLCLLLPPPSGGDVGSC